VFCWILRIVNGTLGSMLIRIWCCMELSSPATSEYFKGFFPGWSHSANPYWASVAENGSSEEEGWSPTMDRGWLKKKKVDVTMGLCLIKHPVTKTIRGQFLCFSQALVHHNQVMTDHQAAKNSDGRWEVSSAHQLYSAITILLLSLVATII